MPREYNIAWNANQRKRLNSAARRYNNALRKAAKNNPMAAQFLPSEVSYQELKSQITTRRALNNTVNRLIRATRKDALSLVRQDDGSLVTRYERGEFNILKSVRERKKSMMAKRKGISMPKANQIGSITQASLSPDKRKASSMSSNALKRFISAQEREMLKSDRKKARRYLRNYMSALDTVFGGFEEYDDAIETIRRRIEALIKKNDLEEFAWAIDHAPDIKFIYDPVLRDAKLDKILDYWLNPMYDTDYVEPEASDSDDDEPK